MKKILSLCVILFMLVSLPLSVSAQTNEIIYDTYIYGNSEEFGDGEPIAIPSVFQTENVIESGDLNVGTFSDISDIFCDGEFIYICDTGNDRVLILDKDLKNKGEISDFDNAGIADSLSGPSGVYSNGERILICDSLNQRMLLFAASDFSLIKIIDKPDIDILEDNTGNYIYTPKKAVFDNAGRFYVIADGVNQGIIRLDKDGKFITFIGAPTVVPNLGEMIWRKFATKEQKKRLQQFVPTEYDSLLIDKDGFIYATSKTSSKEAFVRLNSKGDNILPQISYYGDASQSSYDSEVKPYFVDIAVDDNENCYLLDSRQGKVYVYGKDGTMLYAFGGNSLQKGAFQSASAIEYFNNHLYITDQNKNTITVLKMTEFGKKIHNAKRLYDENDYDGAYSAYAEVKEYCSSYLPATVAMSYIDIQNGNIGNALNKLKQIHDHENYSEIFESLRNKFIREWIIWVIVGAAILLIAVLILKKLIVKKNWLMKIRNNDTYKKYKYSNYVMMHPFDGFWDLKHEKKGNLKSSFILLAVFTVFYGIRAQYSGYVVTKTISNESNAIFECFTILLPLAFWVISNWCFTTLMDGKGTIKDIFIATCYALKPYIVFSIPLFIMSHVLVADEAMFYTVLNAVSLIWMLGLMFFGMITIHDYSLSKGILTAILTIVGILLIIFILLLVISISQNVVDYFFNIYKEITLRLYD